MPSHPQISVAHDHAQDVSHNLHALVSYLRDMQPPMLAFELDAILTALVITSTFADVVVHELEEAHDD